MKGSICLETFFTGVPFAERFQLAAAAGFKWVEFWTWEDKNLEQVARLLKKYDLQLASISGDQDFSLLDKGEQDDYLSFLEESVKIALYLGCEQLVIHSNALGEGGKVLNYYQEVSSEKKWQVSKETLQLAAPLVEKEGVKLLLEALNTKVDHQGNFLETTARAVSIVKGVDSPNIKLLYDIYHMQIMEGNIIQTLRDYLDDIAYIHVADVPGRHEPGTGELNYQNIFKVLGELNYTGFVGFELYPSTEHLGVARMLNRLIRT